MKYPKIIALLWSSLMFTAVLSSGAEELRERISLNRDWRFLKADPDGAGDSLKYETIKAWLLPSGNLFFETPHVRPTGAAPGENLAWVRPDFDDRGWRLLDLPHDWGVESPFIQDLPGETGKLPWWGVAWYRKSFELPASDSGKRIFLDVDGAMSYATVWLNGRFVGGWPYGYASWRLDLTPYIVAGGKNVLVIRVDNPPESSRWYPGGGIYRNVWLVKTSPVHVEQWGSRVTTPMVSKDFARVLVETELKNDSPLPVDATLSTELYLFSGGKVEKVVRMEAAVPLRIESGGRASAREEFMVEDPALWSPANPNRYLAVSSVKVDGKVVDVYKTPFGIRTAEFTAHNGFLLNGERVQIQGVCMHHDLGALGAALNPRALRRQLEILKAMGTNALRVAHNPPAPELLDLADEMGFLVEDEYVDMWATGKKRNDWSRIFKDWSEADLKALIRRDRNHPSVILWSLGNELRELDFPETGIAVGKRLSDIARAADPTRPLTAGYHRPSATSNGFEKIIDVYSFNYKPYNYRTFREQNPMQPVMGGETASCISSRGEYFFPVSEPPLPGTLTGRGVAQTSSTPAAVHNTIEGGKGMGQENFQVSSYDLGAPFWAYPPDIEFAALDAEPFVAGEFVWTGFDYLGEPTPYNMDSTNLLNLASKKDREQYAAAMGKLGNVKVPSRSSYFGIVDTAGFPKDRYYLYQARWRPDYPMAHILPHWNWPERIGKVIPVHVYSSGDEAELFLNGRSLGKKKRGAFEYRFRWDDVVYEPGELRVKTWKNGQEWAEASVRTSGPAVKLAAMPDRKEIASDGTDLSFVSIRIEDKDGQMVPRSKNLLKFSISGPGEIVATDNGDATDHAAFSSKERKAFNGLALVIVKAKRGESGEIRLRAESEGLEPAETRIQAVR